MKNIINQFYNEGFATLFRLKPIGYIKRKTDNETIIKLLSFIISFLYTVAAITLVIILVYNQYN